MRSTPADLVAVVDAVAAIDVRGLPVAGLQELMAFGATARNRLEGVISRALGELQLRGNGSVPDPDVAGAVLPTAAWLRHTAKSTGPAAGRQIRAAVALRELPAVVDAIVDGTITQQHGQVLSRLCGKIDAAALQRSQPELIEVARRCDPNQLEQYVRHLLATWCEPLIDADESAAEDRRFLHLRNTHDGSWRGTFELPDAAMETVLTVLEPLARRDGDDDKRSAGQRRADALTDVFTLAARHAELPRAGGFRPAVSYVVPARWSPALRAAMNRLLTDPLATAEIDGTIGSVGLPPLSTGSFAVELDRHPGQDCATGAWTGPATRSQIETMLCDARILRVVLADDGQVVSLAPVTDTITAAQRRAVAARDRSCVTKGCSRPPAFCDVHHVRARADGGPTDVGKDNLQVCYRPGT